MPAAYAIEPTTSTETNAWILFIMRTILAKDH
jgi:hypothetical protein